MQRMLICVLAAVLCLNFGCGGGVAGGGTNTDGRVDYNITITDSGSFAPLGEGVATSLPQDEQFGPDVGYPEPSFLAAQDAGVVERESFFVFASPDGDLSEAEAAILDSADQLLASPMLHPDSTPTRIGIQVPYDLPGGAYTLQLRTPTDILLAEVTFELENLVPDDADEPIVVGGW
ncbi:MAG: hypothetical protein JSV19_03490 [Phycisphaerales bacterium]|nr:MAG: hypothetical protein JSV19_03490 [Phycisphaerales bacterium]